MVEMKFLGMDFSCALGSLSNGQFPEKDCLLPLISKLLGYCIVAASTTVKLPQVDIIFTFFFFFLSTWYFYNCHGYIVLDPRLLLLVVLFVNNLKEKFDFDMGLWWFPRNVLRFFHIILSIVNFWLRGLRVDAASTIDPFCPLVRALIA